MANRGQSLKNATRRVSTRARAASTDQRGSSLVELSITITMLLVLLFGIITYGVLLSFKSGMTQAAAQGARAAAVVSWTSAASVAQTATADSLPPFGKNCNAADGDGLSCTWNVSPCTQTPSAKCITVEVIYDYKNHPLVPLLPFVGALLPNTLRSNSVAQVNS